VMIVLM
jgi:hypothetical protein